MSHIELVLLLLVATTLLAVVAQRLAVAYPIVLVLGGLALGLVPGLPRVALDPELVFELFLPPLLFASAFFIPWPDFRENLRPILMLAIGLVGATAAAVAYVAWGTLGLPLAVGFLLGAIVSPSDPVAATAIAERLRLPHRLVVVLEGESLINDAAALVMFHFAVLVVATGAWSFSGVLLDFVRLAVGGIALGLAVGWLALQLFRRLDDPTVITVMTVLGPFAAYLPAELLGFSGVLATVAAGIYVGWHGPTAFTPATRVRAGAVWSVLVFLLNGLAFILIGLQLPFILADIAREPPALLVAGALAVVGVVMLVRVVWIFGSNALACLIAPGWRRRDPALPWQQLSVLSWSGMRGIVTLAAALALPNVVASGAPFPERGLILFLAFAVTLGTLVLQGLTLPALVQALEIGAADDAEERTEAQRFALEAALARLDELAARGDLPADGLAHMRLRYEHVLRVLDDTDLAVGDPRTYRTIQLDLIEAERTVLLEMRRHGAISEDVFRDLQRALDMRAAWLD
jgi:CPA1 family monovalent cation:H+ antiporter